MCKKNWVFIAWAPHSRRSESLAKEIGAKLYLIHYLKFQQPLYAPIKYILQTVRTLQVLFMKRPDVVLVQNPPFFCGLVAYLYCRLSRKIFVFDHHSAAFARVWEWALPLQKFLARQAVTNIVTNQHWVDRVQAWGAHALIMGDPFLELPQRGTFAIESGFNIAFVSTYSIDEPLDEVLKAAVELPEIHFYITGDTKSKTQDFFNHLPANVTCTGFLPDAQYVGLLKSVSAVMVLTTRNHTLQLGGCEAVSLGKPLITSNWPYLQGFFAKGTIYVANSADSIRDGILLMQEKHKILAKEMMAFRQDGRREWDTQLAQLKQMISSL